MCQYKAAQECEEKAGLLMYLKSSCYWTHCTGDSLFSVGLRNIQDDMNCIDGIPGQELSF